MVAMGPEPTAESTKDGWKVLESAIQERERIIATLSLGVERGNGKVGENGRGVFSFAPGTSYRLATSIFTDY